MKPNFEKPLNRYKDLNDKNGKKEKEKRRDRCDIVS